MNNAPFLIGLTGGVASGKSTVAHAFERLGIFVADADLAARDAVAIGSEGLAEVIAAFGVAVLDRTGSLDRAAMRARVFADDEARKRLEAIVHPRVRAALRAACIANKGPYAIAAIPLLAEGGRAAYTWLDRILVVDAPMDTQRERLLKRDGVDPPLAERMIAVQATRLQRMAIADDVLVNDASLAALEGHALALHRRYLDLASAR